jgi:hypothetical protein
LSLPSSQDRLGEGAVDIQSNDAHACSSISVRSKRELAGDTDNGQVERMNRTIKDATVKRYFYETHDELRTHLCDFVDAYNFARRLKTLKGLTL